MEAGNATGGELYITNRKDTYQRKNYILEVTLRMGYTMARGRYIGQEVHL